MGTETFMVISELPKCMLIIYTICPLVRGIVVSSNMAIGKVYGKSMNGDAVGNIKDKSTSTTYVCPRQDKMLYLLNVRGSI